MKSSEIIGWLKNYYMSRIRKNIPFYSVLLLGPPGIGKSEGVEEAAREIAKELGKEFIDYDESIAQEILSNPDKYFVFVDFRLTEVEPTDLIGYPREVDGAVTYKPLLWAKVLSKCSGILFLDEITNVNRIDTQSASYKPVRDYKAGFTKFSKGVLVVAAGNRPEDSSISNFLPAPLVNRFIKIEVDIPTISDWVEYMNRTYESWDRSTYAYLKLFSSDFIKLPKEAETLENYPTPRTWTQVALIDDITKEEAIGLLGSEVGNKYVAFRKMQIPSIEEIVKRPAIFNDLSLDQKYLVCASIANNFIEWLERDEFRKFAIYIAREAKEFLVLMIKMSGKRGIVPKLFKIPEVRDELKHISAYVRARR